MTIRTKRNGDAPTLKSFFTDFFNYDYPNFDLDSFGGRLFKEVPAANIKETEKSYRIELAVPGMKKNDFHVKAENGFVCIEAEKEFTEEEKDETFMRKEYNYNSFSRKFRLPDFVEPDEMKAKYTDGILYVNIPKKEEAIRKPAKEVEIL